MAELFLFLGQLNINWTSGGGDASTPLNYTVEYSPDGGETWQSLAVDWPTESYSIDSQVLRASTQSIVQAVASDGLVSSSPQGSSMFTVQPHPPSILLNAPMSGSHHRGRRRNFPGCIRL